MGRENSQNGKSNLTTTSSYPFYAYYFGDAPTLKLSLHKRSPHSHHHHLFWNFWKMQTSLHYITYSKGRCGHEAFFTHLSVPSSIHGWHHTGKKTLAEINNTPSAHVSLSRKGMPGPGVWSFTMVSCMLLSHRSQAVQTSRFSTARVPMDTCGMWYIERFWKCSL